MSREFTTIIQTERLLLRPFTPADIEPSYQVNLDPLVSRYTHDGGVKTLEEIDHTIRTNVLGDYQKYGFGRFAVIHKHDNRFIGFAGLKYLPDLDQVDIGYRFHSHYWGQGIATECGQVILPFGFDVLGLDHIIGQILPENEASRRVLEKLHFSFEKEFVEEGVTVHQFGIDLHDYRKHFTS